MLSEAPLSPLSIALDTAVLEASSRATDSNCEDLLFPLAHAGDKESNDFTSIKSLADYHVCEQFVTDIT
jgi:hypothetical protein